jgi:protein phosphatase
MTSLLTVVDRQPPEVPNGAAYELALVSDVGNHRTNNEDACGQWCENDESVVFAVADGVGGYEGGEIASEMAVEITLEAYRESPVAWGPSKRLHRAIQRANIEIHNRALTVPELRRMATTLTAVAVTGGVLHAVHVGDCRLYLIRRRHVRQLSKDHTAVQERVRMGLMSAARARSHPERSSLTRSLGRELIVSVDRITMPLERDDRVVLCTDGVHGVLDDGEIEHAIRDADPESSCRHLIDLANRQGGADNLTVAVMRVHACSAKGVVATGWRGRLAAWLGRGR